MTDSKQTDEGEHVPQRTSWPKGCRFSVDRDLMTSRRPKPSLLQDGVSKTAGGNGGLLGGR